MKPLNFHPDAAEEAREVAAHYAAIRAELGTGFQVELDAALARIQDNPGRQLWTPLASTKRHPAGASS
jgi:hypothetical protein